MAKVSPTKKLGEITTSSSFLIEVKKCDRSFARSFSVKYFAWFFFGI